MVEIDWVTARAACSLYRVFTQLRLQVEQDMKARIAQLSDEKNPPHFEFVANGESFTVARVIGQKLSDVTFCIEPPYIRVNGLAQPLAGTATISDDGECRLKVGSQEMDFWQFRKRALEDLLFSFTP